MGDTDIGTKVLQDIFFPECLCPVLLEGYFRHLKLEIGKKQLWAELPPCLTGLVLCKTEQLSCQLKPTEKLN